MLNSLSIVLNIFINHFYRRSLVDQFVSQPVVMLNLAESYAINAYLLPNNFDDTITLFKKPFQRLSTEVESWRVYDKLFQSNFE